MIIAECTVPPRPFDPRHEYSPPSSVLALLTFNLALINPFSITRSSIANLFLFVVISVSSTNQVIHGRGLPENVQIRVSEGPACKTRLLKPLTITGTASEISKKLSLTGAHREIK